MPSILFHELIGYKFAKKYKEYDTPNFYLGLMVPDSVNAYGFASKEQRWKVHFRDSNLEIWEKNIIDFYKNNKEKYDKNYITGYFLHVLTDIYCDKVYKNKIYSDLIEKGYNYESAYSYYENEIKKYENSNINEQWWKYVQENLTEAEKIEINGMNQKMIEDWINYNLDKYSKRNYEEADYINDDFANTILEMLETQF
jgi:hypothetical protein